MFEKQEFHRAKAETEGERVIKETSHGMRFQTKGPTECLTREENIRVILQYTGVKKKILKQSRREKRFSPKDGESKGQLTA